MLCAQGEENPSPERRVAAVPIGLPLPRLYRIEVRVPPASGALRIQVRRSRTDWLIGELLPARERYPQLCLDCSLVKALPCVRASPHKRYPFGPGVEWQD